MFDAAKIIKNDKIKFLFWGAGDTLDLLVRRAKEENIKNVVFKGRVDKKYIPYITSKADVNVVHGNQSNIFRFGISANKIFDCISAERPILVTYHSKYNPIIENQLVFEPDEYTPEAIAKTVEEMSKLSKREKEALKEKASKVIE